MTQNIRQRHALKRKKAAFAVECLWAVGAAVVMSIIVVMFLITFLESPL